MPRETPMSLAASTLVISLFMNCKDFKWNDQNMPFGNSLDVFNFKEDSIFDQKLFEDIDETLYGCVKFDNIKDKVEWVCSNFEKVARRLNDVTGN